MRIVVHDYAGHPFQVQLSRSLAARGHQVHHLYFVGEKTPRGAITPRPDDPVGLAIEPIAIAGEYHKYHWIKRHLQEKEYGRNAARRINEIDPTVLICANTPVDALAAIRRSCCAGDRKFIIWLQDLESVGVGAVLRRRWPLLSRPVAWRYQLLERANLARADKIVCIADDFVAALARFGIPAARCEVIENWAPLDELEPHVGPNGWARAQGLGDRRLVIYAGTLGLKHNPELLAAAARAMQGSERCRDVVLVVISEGRGADWLRERKAAEGLDHLLLLPFQPYERLAEVLSAAAVLVAVLEADAGVFSVPSKVLSYLCVGRPILLAAPAQNLAARTLRRAGAGVLVEPTDVEGFCAGVRRLMDDGELRRRLGASGRRYARAAFDLDRVTDRFERVLTSPREARLAPAAESPRGCLEGPSA